MTRSMHVRLRRSQSGIGRSRSGTCSAAGRSGSSLPWTSMTPPGSWTFRDSLLRVQPKDRGRRVPKRGSAPRSGRPLLGAACCHVACGSASVVWRICVTRAAKGANHAPPPLGQHVRGGPWNPGSLPFPRGRKATQDRFARPRRAEIAVTCPRKHRMRTVTIAP